VSVRTAASTRTSAGLRAIRGGHIGGSVEALERKWLLAEIEVAERRRLFD
jgi:hypothetical protein